MNLLAAAIAGFIGASILFFIIPWPYSFFVSVAWGLLAGMIPWTK